MRVGIGYDIHALKKGRKLILGGVTIPFSKGLFGHSDADVLMHAIVDAALGAMAEGDIGDHFSDKDAANKNMPSAIFVKKIKGLLAKKSLRVENIDSTIIAEAPKLTPFKRAIRLSIAALFDLNPVQVNVKAKTNEGFGALGRQKAMAAWAVVSLTKKRA